MKYKLQKVADLTWVVDIEENKSIPFDPANTDYQAYLAWLADGNEPLPADEPTQE
jgi:hypothetical protein